MNYLNLHTDFLRSELYLGAEPIERATWLNLLAWCASQENGGVIEGAESWTDRKWQQLCGVTLEEVKTISLLYGYENGNLMVSNYPLEKEAEVKSKREAGKKGGRPKKQSPSEPLKNKGEKPHGYDMLKASDNHHVKTVKTEREGKEKDKDKENENTPLPPEGDEFKLIINKLFNRRASTKWSEKELRAYRKLNIDHEEMNLIEKYYDEATGSKYRRKDVQTLLNNWLGEVDRARSWTPEGEKLQTETPNSRTIGTHNEGQTFGAGTNPNQIEIIPGLE